MQFRSTGFSSIGPAVKNIIIINVILYIFSITMKGFDLSRYFALYYPASDYFKPYQLITHMFMHGSLTHIFFNMFAFWMFGRILEQVWGTKRFLIYYFFTGIGAACLHLFVNYLEINPILNAYQVYLSDPSPDSFTSFIMEYFPGYDSQINDFVNSWNVYPHNPQFIEEAQNALQQIINERIDIPTVGASGAVYGILLAFGMLFPNTELFLLFPPIPIKAKWLVIGYGAIEIYLGITQPGSNIAHFAHLGGMIFGFILVKIWNKTSRNFY